MNNLCAKPQSGLSKDKHAASWTSLKKPVHILLEAESTSRAELGCSISASRMKIGVKSRGGGGPVGFQSAVWSHVRVGLYMQIQVKPKCLKLLSLVSNKGFGLFQRRPTPPSPRHSVDNVIFSCFPQSPSTKSKVVHLESRIDAAELANWRPLNFSSNASNKFCF